MLVELSQREFRLLDLGCGDSVYVYILGGEVPGLPCELLLPGACRLHRGKAGTTLGPAR
jgi:hypothetical protein